MSWHPIAETKRCEGKQFGRRCKTILRVGEWFWLEGKKAFCATCATSSHVCNKTPSTELTKRRAQLLHISGQACPPAAS